MKTISKVYIGGNQLCLDPYLMLMEVLYKRYVHPIGLTAEISVL